MKSTEMCCCEMPWRNPGDVRFNNFYPNSMCVRMCGHKVVHRVAVTEKPNQIPVNVEDYWGWWNFEQAAFLFVYPHQGLLNMCFPYGPEPLEAKGEGIRLAVEITVLERDIK